MPTFFIRSISSSPSALFTSICFSTAVTNGLLSKSPRTCSKSISFSNREPSAPKPVMEARENSFFASS